MSKQKIKIATLCCSYNRLDKTIAFFNSLIHQSVPQNYQVDFYLLDDNSPDKTGEHIKSQFPVVNVIQGTGNLFWAGGMRTLWKEVRQKDDHDFYLLLNDDVILNGDALKRLLDAYDLAGKPGNIILGTVLDPFDNKITYGGHRIKNFKSGSLYAQKPDDKELIKCEIGNANIMLVDKLTVDKIGILSDLYTHSLADFDYTYTAVKNKLHLWLAPGYYGYCENDHSATSWLPGRIPLKDRIAHLYSPKGLAYKEYLTFIRRHFWLMLPAEIIKSWVKTLFPSAYDSLKKHLA